MKQTFASIIISCIIISCFSCKNKTDDTPLPADKSQQISQIITERDGRIDTTKIYFEDKNIILISTNNTTAIVSTDSFIREDNQYIINKYSGTTRTHYGHYKLNDQGKVIESLILRSPTDTNNTAHYTYNSAGNNIRDITYYVNYQNDYLHHYEGGNIHHTIYDLTHFTDPSRTKRDSISYVYSDHRNLLNLNIIGFLYGNPTQQLVIQRINYNSSGVPYSSIHYEYELDDKGYVTKKIDTYKYLPSEEVYTVITYYYTYELI